MSEINFHRTELEYRRIRRKIDRSDMCPVNKALLDRFCTACIAEGLSQIRAAKYIESLKKIDLYLGKAFESATKEDIQRVAVEIETSSYSGWYKHDLKVALKKFYKWLRGTDDYPEEVRWLKTTVRNLNRKLPEELVTQEEADRMIQCADNARDRAFVAVLFDSGCRIGEIGTLQVKHVEFDKYGAAIIVSGKTGMRRVRLVPSVPSLAQWLSFHWRRSDPDAPLWLSFEKRKGIDHLTYGGASSMLKHLAAKANVTKRLYAYLFRHASATFWADKLTEAQMCERFGWVQGSRQAATYVHLSGRNVDDSVLRTYGLKKDQSEPESKLTPRTCPRCRTDNEAAAKFCTSCGMALDPIAAKEAESELEGWNEKMTKLVKDREVQTLLIRKLQEMDQQTPGRRASA